MPVTTQDLALQVRRGIGDWGAFLMKLAVGLTDSATTVQVTPSSTDYLRAGLTLNIDVEDMEVAEPFGNPITVIRARRGTANTTHTAGALVLLAPRFTNQAVVDALNESVRCFSSYVPYLKEDSTTITLATGTEEYSLPSDCEKVVRVEMERSTAGLYRPWRTFDVDYATNKIKILGRFSAGRHVRVQYHARWTELTWSTSDVVIDSYYHGFLTDYAVAELLVRESMEKLATVVSAKGDTPGMRDSLVSAQTMRAAAERKLTYLADVTRIIHKRDIRLGRM